MNSPIQTMLQKYNCQSIEDYKRAIKEIVQEVALCGLSRGRFIAKRVGCIWI